MDDNDAELIRKLGITPDTKLTTLYAPEYYLEVIPNINSCKHIDKLLPGSSWIQAFYTNQAALEDEIPKLKSSLTVDGQLWICWPKKSSLVASDLSDSGVRRIGLSSGLVDVKVASIDETWSGLKFVFRLNDR
jgi:hypothetical protein